MSGSAEPRPPAGTAAALCPFEETGGEAGRDDYSVHNLALLPAG